MRGKWVIAGAAIVLAAIAAGALSRLRSAGPRQATATVKASEAPAPPTEINVSGKIDPQHVVTVGAQVAGTIQEFLAEVGQEVYAGQLLARISNQGLQAAEESARMAVEVAQARLEKASSAITAARLEATRARADAMRGRVELDRAQRTYDRQRMLNREGATPRLAYEKAEREFEAAESESQSLEDLARIAEERIRDLEKEEESAKRLLEDKNKDLDDARAGLQAAEVHAPVDGLLVERKGEVGKEVGAEEQAAMFRIAVDLAQLQVTAAVDGGAAARVKAGDAAMVIVAELGGEGVPGVVKEMQVNQATVTFTSPNAAVKPGMSAQVRIKLE